MGRIMAIDYGIRRTGLAVTDPLRIIATALATVDTPRLMDYIKDYCAREEVDAFAVGEAKRMDNTPSESMRYIRPFVEQLAQAFPSKPIEMVDERFTSKMAFQSIIDSGVKRQQRRNKAAIDAVAATLILQSYMNTHK